MTREETVKLFALLAQLHPRKPMPTDTVTVAIWTEVLKPWPYSEVRDAAIRRSRESRYAPEPADLVEFLPAVEEPRKETPVDKKAATWAREYHDRLREELAKRGLDPFTGKTGAEYLAWKARRETAGLDLGALVVETEVRG